MKHGTEMLFYVSFGAGMAMGTSSFTMISGVFELVTSLWAVSAVCLAGLLCIIISHSIAELASMYPSAPGIRTYLKVAFGDRTSLFLVHLYLIFVVLIAGVESYMFALVVKAILPSVSPLGVVMALLITVIITNLLGLELPRWMQIFWL
jgi:ethanolamine permease